MSAAARNVLVIVLLVVVPLLLGVLVVGPGTPSGRNTHSTTRVGHKVFALLLEELGYEVHRFERGVEAPPREEAVFIALEPGPAFLRDGGRFARGLLDYVSAGNGALLTLGPDSDRSAEIDDRDQLLGETAKRAIEAAREVERKAKERAEREKSAENAENTAPDRGIDRPILSMDTFDPADSWDIEQVARFLELRVSEHRLLQVKKDDELRLSGPLAEQLSGGPPVLKITRPRVFRFFGEQTPRILLELNGEPLLFEMSFGRGKLYVLSEPRLLQNGALARAAHAELAVRLVESLAAVNGKKVVYFEEQSHGGREAANIFELSWKTAAKWPLLQLVLVTLLWVAHVALRRRSVVPFEVPPRRSRHEVIDAMASLYLRSGDTPGAAARLAELSRRRIARALGAPQLAGDPAKLAIGAAQRTSRAPEEIGACLADQGVASTTSLVERAERLRLLRIELDEPK